MLLQHNYLWYIPDFPELIEGVTTLREFELKIAKRCDKHPNVIKPDDYKGYAFEIFVEFLFKYLNGDPTTTYVVDYEPNNERDKGIDGIGRSIKDGLGAYVQAKYRSNPTYLLKNDDNVSNLGLDAHLNYHSNFNGYNWIIVTNCKGVHPEHPAFPCHQITRKRIQRMVDNIPVFWEDFRSVVQESLQAGLDSYGFTPTVA